MIRAPVVLLTESTGSARSTNSARDILNTPAWGRSPQVINRLPRDCAGAMAPEQVNQHRSDALGGFFVEGLTHAQAESPSGTPGGR